jgi:DNA-binding beta-propeller fold protein YncE
VVDAAGQLERLIRPLIPPGNKPLRPAGLAVTERGKIWLSDSENRRVFLLDEDGTLLRAIGDTAQSPDDYVFGLPAGLALDADGNLYVADAGQGLVKKYSPLGVFLLAIGGSDAAPGPLDTPRDVAVDESGTVFVTDTERGVQVFAADGTYEGAMNEGEAGGSAQAAGDAFAISAGSGRLYVIDGASRLDVLRSGEAALHHSD